MNRAEPTTGEWKAECTGVYVDAADGECVRVANVDVDSRHDISYPTACANARLFAASKDLLAACEAALKWATYWDTNDQAKRDADTIRAAIAKAKGEL